MAALTASGIGSGLDVNSIVSQLMSLERRPLDLLDKQSANLSSQISAYGQLKSALSTFQTAMQGLSSADKFQVYTATSSDQTIFSATADKTAVAGNHSIDVLALAQAHKLTSGSAGSPTYATDTTSIGQTGTLEITQDISGTPRTFQVTIDSTNNTLAGIRDAINNSTNNTGVVASVVNTGTESKLVLSAKDTGLKNAITIGANTSSNISTALGFETLAGNAAADASVKIDGITISSSSNSVSGALQGVTLSLNKVGSSQTLDVARDNTTVQASVQKFVDAYNDIRKVMKTLGAADGTLSGETVLNGIERKIQSVFNTSASGLAYTSLSEVGINTDPKTGDLTLDSTKLNTAMTANYSGVADLFSNSTQGFAVRYESMASSMIASDGIISTRTDGINSQISSLDKRRSDMEYRLTQTEAKLRAQYTALDGLVAQLQSTGNFLTQQLAKLPG